MLTTDLVADLQLAEQKGTQVDDLGWGSRLDGARSGHLGLTGQKDRLQHPDLTYQPLPQRCLCPTVAS